METETGRATNKFILNMEENEQLEKDIRNARAFCCDTCHRGQIWYRDHCTGDADCEVLNELESAMRNGYVIK